MFSRVFKGFTVFAGVRKEADKAPVIAHCTSTHGEIAGSKVIPIILDVTNDDHIANVLTTIEQWVAANNKPFVGLVNNAGIAMFGPVETMSMTTFRSSLCGSPLCKNIEC